LLADTSVGSGIHQQHAEQHNMTSNTTGVHVVDLECEERSNLRLFDVEKVDVVTSSVDDGEEQHRVSNLPMEPEVLVEGKPPDLGTNPSDDSSADRQQDQSTIYGQNQTSSSGNPHGELKTVQTGQPGICRLFIPSESKQSPMKPPEENVENNLGGGELLLEK